MSPERRVLSSSIVNASGWIVQVLLNLILIPVLISRLGVDAFGVYAVVLTLIGYFSIAQGINQATLKFLAEHLSRREHAEAQGAIGASLVLSTVLGLLGMAAILITADSLSGRVFEIPDALQPTAHRAFQVVSFGFLPTTLGLTLTAIPQAMQKYEVPNLVMILGGILNLLVTLVVVLLGHGLVAVVVVNVVVAVLNMTALGISASRLLKPLGIRTAWSTREFRRIVRFSIFSFGSSIIGTVLHHLDRLVIAAVSGTASVAMYAVAQLPMTRLMTLITKLCEVLVPQASRLASTSQLERLERTYVKASKYVLMLTATVFMPLIILAEPVLRYWIGADLARTGGAVMSILGVGYFLRSFSSIPSVVNLGMGRPQVNTAFAIVNLAIVGTMIVPVMRSFGVVGVAWLSVVGSLNSIILVLVTNRIVMRRGNREYFSRVIARPLLVMTAQAAFLIFFAEVRSVVALLAVVTGSMLLSFVLSLSLDVVDPDERAFLWQRLAVVAGRRRE